MVHHKTCPHLSNTLYMFKKHLIWYYSCDYYGFAKCSFWKKHISCDRWKPLSLRCIIYESFHHIGDYYYLSLSLRPVLLCYPRRWVEHHRSHHFKLLPGLLCPHQLLRLSRLLGQLPRYDTHTHTHTHTPLSARTSGARPFPSLIFCPSLWERINIALAASAGIIIKLA